MHIVVGTGLMDTDEHPKPDTTVEKLSTLLPVFKKDGTVTAGNASVCYVHRVLCDHIMMVI